MIEDLLKLSATVTRETYTNDGMGDGYGSTVTSTTTISKCAIWANSLNESYFSDKMSVNCSHTFVCPSDLYTFTRDDKSIISGGVTYDIAGMPDNVFNEGVFVILPLERRV